jgi:hypothetical protein
MADGKALGIRLAGDDTDQANFRTRRPLLNERP